MKNSFVNSFCQHLCLHILLTIFVNSFVCTFCWWFLSTHFFHSLGIVCTWSAYICQKIFSTKFVKAFCQQFLSVNCPQIVNTVCQHSLSVKFANIFVKYFVNNFCNIRFSMSFVNVICQCFLLIVFVKLVRRQRLALLVRLWADDSLTTQFVRSVWPQVCQVSLSMKIRLTCKITSRRLLGWDSNISKLCLPKPFWHIGVLMAFQVKVYPQWWHFSQQILSMIF